MKIRKNDPLPDHTKLDYYECVAKITLEDLFPDRYQDLKVLDKPDLQGKEIGIEVTKASDQRHEEILNNWLKANETDDENLKSFYIDRMKHLGKEYTDGFITWPEYQPKFELVKTAIEKKEKKVLSGGYREFGELDLFIFTDVGIYYDVIAEANEYMTCKAHNSLFRIIYVFSRDSELHIYNLHERKYYKIDVTGQTERNIMAREMVIDGEESGSGI